MRVIAECYANQCFALELKHYVLNLRRNFKVYIGHNYRFGRDRILKLIEKNADQVNDLIIAIIDYEKGISRKYIDSRFKLSEIKDSILFGKHKHKNNIVAIIFDPNIEEAVLCRYFPILCRDIDYYEQIKSDKACDLLEEYLKRKPVSEIILMIAETITHYYWE